MIVGSADRSLWTEVCTWLMMCGARRLRSRGEGAPISVRVQCEGRTLIFSIGRALSCGSHEVSHLPEATTQNVSRKSAGRLALPAEQDNIGLWSVSRFSICSATMLMGLVLEANKRPSSFPWRIGLRQSKQHRACPEIVPDASPVARCAAVVCSVAGERESSSQVLMHTTT